MRGYSQGRAGAPEAGRVKDALGALDKRIMLPDSLRGSALLHKLDGIQPDVPTEKKVWELVLPRRPRLRVIAGYAAALVLVVGLFYNIGLNRPVELAPGEIAIGGNQTTELPPLLPGGGGGPVHPAESTRLGEFGEFFLYHQPGVLLLTDAGGQTVSRVEVPSLTSTPVFSAEGDLLTLHSTDSSSLNRAYTIDFSDPHNPVVLVQ